MGLFPSAKELANKLIKSAAAGQKVSAKVSVKVKASVKKSRTKGRGQRG